MTTTTPAGAGPDVPLAADVCFFAHYDPDGRVDPYVELYLRAIAACGFSIVFVSAGELRAEDAARISSLCADVLTRSNGGLDFGSWSEAFARHGAAVRGRLLLANDSVYGPIGDLAAMLRRLTATPSDLYGLVESLQISPHLQSWFLLFEPRAHRSDAFRRLMSQDFAAMAKRDIIRNGEVAATASLVAAGFRYRPLVVQSPMVRRLAFNPTHFLWRELLTRDGLPFVKIELLRDKMGPEMREDALREIARISPEWADLIRAHLARMAGRRPAAPLNRPTRIYRRLVQTLYRLETDGYWWIAAPASLAIAGLAVVGRKLWGAKQPQA